jgi:hypothetical protein
LVMLLRFANGVVFHLCFTRPILHELKRIRS